MKKYQVVISKAAGNELRRLPKNEIARIYSKMQSLADNPRPPGCKKLEGSKEGLWRIRVGNYRIIYSIDDSVCVVDIQYVGDRKDIYRK